jgi:hypothetical protein
MTVMTAFRAGMALAWARLRGPGTAFAAVTALVCATLVAVIERSTEPYYAADRALTGGVFGLILPLLGYLVLERVTVGARLDHSVDELSRHGADRRWLGLGLYAVAALALAAIALLLAVTGVCLSRGAKDPLLLRDLAATSWIAVLSGVAYAAWFSLASLVGRRGRRGTAWLADLLLGSGGSVLAAPLPRGHVRNLLGGQPVLELTQWASAVALIALTAFYLSASASRTPR